LPPKHQWIIAHIRLATNENERHIRAEMSHLLDPLRNVKPALSNRCKEIHLFLHVTERGWSVCRKADEEDIHAGVTEWAH
jgi:hypothetical protein